MAQVLSEYWKDSMQIVNDLKARKISLSRQLSLAKSNREALREQLDQSILSCDELESDLDGVIYELEREEDNLES
jgi:hypothetical protein